MALYLGKLLPQNSQKPNYETHHPPYGTFRQREATRMTLLFPILRQSFINRSTLHGLHFQREKLENEVFLKRPIENI
jgi:hypothetical protein